MVISLALATDPRLMEFLVAGVVVKGRWSSDSFFSQKLTGVSLTQFVTIECQLEVALA
jgi:hypothetical protein